MNTNNIVIASGGFDPLTSAHIDYLSAANLLGRKLYVGVNSDNWLKQKKGNFFMSEEERVQIVGSIAGVTDAMLFDDSDGTAIDLIKRVIHQYEYMSASRYLKPNFIFVNGGDRTADNIPEMNHEYSQPVQFLFGIGGTEKTQSSSELLARWVRLNI